MKRLDSLLMLLSLSFCMCLAQTRRGWGGDLSLSSRTDQGQGMFHGSIMYNWQLNNYVIVSTGAILSYIKNAAIESWVTRDHTTSEQNPAFYRLDIESIGRINIAGSVTLLSPMLKKTGLYAELLGFIEPIPFNYISIGKSTVSELDYQYSGKYVFTKFAPGAFTTIGIYHKLEKADNVGILYLGFGFGWHDPYIAYRMATIEGQQLAPRLPTCKTFYRLTIRLIGY